jgi:hypothetical protein
MTNIELFAFSEINCSPKRCKCSFLLRITGPVYASGAVAPSGGERKLVRSKPEVPDPESEAERGFPENPRKESGGLWPAEDMLPVVDFGANCVPNALGGFSFLPHTPRTGAGFRFALAGVTKVHKKRRAETGAYSVWDFLHIHAKNPDYPASLCSLQGIKIHFREFLYDLCAKHNKLLAVFVTQGGSSLDRTGGINNSEFKKWSNTGRLLKGLTGISGGYLAIFTMLSRVFCSASPLSAGEKTCDSPTASPRGTGTHTHSVNGGGSGNKVPAPSPPMDPYEARGRTHNLGPWGDPQGFSVLGF